MMKSIFSWAKNSHENQWQKIMLAASWMRAQLATRRSLNLYTQGTNAMSYAAEIDGQKIALENDLGWRMEDEIKKLLPKIRWGHTDIASVKIYKVEVDKYFVPKFTFVKTIDVEPLKLPITQEDYRREMESIVEELPEEFRDYVRGEAYDRGHSSGYEETLQIAQDIVHSLKKPIENYTLNQLKYMAKGG